MSESIKLLLETSDSEYKDLYLSLGFIIVTFLGAQFTRLCIKWILKDPKGITRCLLMETLASFELCASCFEVCVIADNYGVWWYALVLYFMCIWYCLTWEDASACPYTHIENLVIGQAGFKMTLLIIFTELLGGISAYPFYVKKFWMYKFIPQHSKRIYQNKCPADLTVPIWQGACIEGLATCICQLTSRVMSRFSTTTSNIVSNLIGVFMVVAAFDLTGGYFNPVLGTALQYNCGEVTRKEHFIVYWIGSIAGSVLHILLWNHKAVYNYLMYGPPKPKLE